MTRESLTQDQRVNFVRAFVCVDTFEIQCVANDRVVEKDSISTEQSTGRTSDS